jgi:hypothetical protein
MKKRKVFDEIGLDLNELLSLHFPGEINTGHENSQSESTTTPPSFEPG